MPLVAGAAEWLASTPLSQAMRGSLWLYPVVETVHIAGFAVLVGAVALFDLRVLGCARTLPVRALGRHLLRWALASLLLVLPAGAYRSVAAWDTGRPAPPLARLQAALSLLLWLAIITCGRMLAYV